MLSKLNINKDKIIRSLSMFLLFYYFANVLVAFLMICGFNPSNVTDKTKMNIILMTISSMIIFIINIIVFRKDLVKEFKQFKNKFLDNIDTGFKYWILGLIIMFTCNFILVFVLHSGGANNEKAVQDYIKAMPLLMSFNVCFLAPFNEEIAFRKTLYDVFKNKWVFVFLSFLLFGSAHIINSYTRLLDLLYIIPYGTLGGCFAYIYHKTNTVFTSMFFHIFHNTCLFLLSVLI